ncbi:MAG: redoxin family protein [Bacteroidia bacterium]|nr:redoxin family protein [Bacteroidia bacterium]
MQKKTILTLLISIFSMTLIAQNKIALNDTVIVSGFEFIPFNKLINSAQITVVTFVVYDDCYYCANETMQISKELQSYIIKKEVQYIVVYLERDMNYMRKISDYAQKMKVNYSYCMDYYGKLVNSFSLKGYPTTVVIGETGNIEFRQNGPKNNTNSEDLINKVKELTSKVDITDTKTNAQTKEEKRITPGELLAILKCKTNDCFNQILLAKDYELGIEKAGYISYFSKKYYYEYDEYAEVDIDFTKRAKEYIIIVKPTNESQKINGVAFQTIDWDQSFKFKNQLKEIGFIELDSNSDEYGAYKLLKSQANPTIYVKYYEQKSESQGKMYRWYEFRFYLN